MPNHHITISFSSIGQVVKFICFLQTAPAMRIFRNAKAMYLANPAALGSVWQVAANVSVAAVIVGHVNVHVLVPASN